jgi:hypothetical protein
VDLRDLAYLPIRDVTAHRVHVVYFCNEELRDTFGSHVDGHATVIGFDGSRFRFAGAALPDAKLQACLDRAEILPDVPPLGIVPFDAESPDEEIARAVIPHVVEALVQGSGTITDDLIVSKTHQLTKSAMTSTGSGSELGAIIKRTRNVLDELAAGELAPWFGRAPNQQPPVWRLLKALPTEGRTRELQSIQRAASQYLERRGAKVGLQLPLFGEDASVTNE